MRGWPLSPEGCVLYGKASTPRPLLVEWWRARPVRAALPFLLEALVTALIGVALAGGALAAFMYFGIDQRAATGLKFMPWIGLPEYTTAVICIAILGPILTLLPTLVLTRKYLKV